MIINSVDYCLGCFEPKDGADVCPACGWYEGMTLMTNDGPEPGAVLHGRYAIGRILDMSEQCTAYLALDIKSGGKLVLKRYPHDGGDGARYEAEPYAEGGKPANVPSEPRQAEQTEPHAAAPLGAHAAAGARTNAKPRGRVALIASGGVAALILVAFLVTRLVSFDVQGDALARLPDPPTATADVSAGATDAAPPAVMETPAVQAEYTPPQTASPAPETPAPPVQTEAAWSDWDTAFAKYASDTAYVTEQRKEYRSARVRYIESAWSSWGTTPTTGKGLVEESMYRTRSLTTVYGEGPEMTGYVPTGRTSLRAGEWSAWSEQEAQPSDTVEVETRQETKPGGTAMYRYSRYLYSNETGGNDAAAANPGNGTLQRTDWMSAPLNPMGGGAYGPLNRDGVDRWFNEETSWSETTGETVTLYRTRVLKVVYEFAGWSEWTEWKDGKVPAATDSLQVEARYRTKTRDAKTDAWSPWQEEPIEAKSDLQVETRTVYRYKPL